MQGAVRLVRETRKPIAQVARSWGSDDPDMYVWLEDEIASSADIEFIASAREPMWHA
jgi:transposase-like protein